MKRKIICVFIVFSLIITLLPLRISSNKVHNSTTIYNHVDKEADLEKILTTSQTDKQITDLNGFNEEKIIQHGQIYQKLQLNRNNFLKNQPDCSFQGNGSLLWKYVETYQIFPRITMCDNGKYIFVGKHGHYNFELFKINGTGTPKWEYQAPSGTHYVQVAGSGEGDVIVGAVASDPFLPPYDFTQRLYKFNISTGEPDWNFDIPKEFTIFTGGVIEENLAVSDNGEKIVLVTKNWTQQISKIFMFNADSNIPIMEYSLRFPNKSGVPVAIDISYDGSLLLIIYLTSVSPKVTIVLDTINSEIRYWGDEIAKFSDDGKTLVQYYQDEFWKHSFKVLEWDNTQEKYVIQWDNANFSEKGWLIMANGQTIEISDDGSTIITGVADWPTNKSMVAMYSVKNRSLLWRHYSVSDGKYSSDIMMAHISDTGNRAVAAYGLNEKGNGAGLKLFDRKSSKPVFEIDSPGEMSSVDISPDSLYACGGADLYPNEYTGTIVYAIGLDQQPKPIMLIEDLGIELFKVKVIIRNTGEVAANNLTWDIALTPLDDKAFIISGKNTNGIIKSLKPNEQKSITSKIIFGLGNIKTTIKVETDTTIDELALDGKLVLIVSIPRYYLPP